MISRVTISRNAQDDLRRVPPHIVRKLQGWILAVEEEGIDRVRRIPGFHDEPLKGQRDGQRSIRLNQAYRAIYEIQFDGSFDFICIEEVNKHAY